MKQFEGKLVIRVKPRQIRSYPLAMHSIGYIGSRIEAEYDRSYMTAPIKIERVMNHHAYYSDYPNGNLKILPADYFDEHWEVCDEEFAKQYWIAKDKP